MKIEYTSFNKARKGNLKAGMHLGACNAHLLGSIEPWLKVVVEPHQNAGSATGDEENAAKAIVPG